MKIYYLFLFIILGLLLGYSMTWIHINSQLEEDYQGWYESCLLKPDSQIVEKEEELARINTLIGENPDDEWLNSRKERLEMELAPVKECRAMEGCPTTCIKKLDRKIGFFEVYSHLFIPKYELHVCLNGCYLP